MTWRHLAGGESHMTLSLYFMIARPTISKFIPEVLGSKQELEEI